MQIAAGQILTSSATIDDPNFRGSVVLITEYNEAGAMAFVINKLFERPLNALVEFSSSPAFPLYQGGPVDTEHLFFIHRHHELIPGGTKISGDIYLGGDFAKAVSLINNKTLDGGDIKIFIGYCGWDAGELEAEIAEGSWNITEAAAGIAFNEELNSLLT